MMSRLADLAVSTTFAGSLLLANTSCATRHPDGAATSAPRSETQVPGVQRLVQFSFGTQAAFGVCVEPACPAVTPKTLAMAGAAPMQVLDHARKLQVEPEPKRGGRAHRPRARSGPKRRHRCACASIPNRDHTERHSETCERDDRCV